MLDYITSIINPAMDVATEQTLSDIAHRLRIHSIEATNASNSGHPTSCSSMAEIMSVLFFNQMKYDPTYPRSPANDRFILSKGHAAPILYAAWAEAGVVPVTELKKLRQMDNLLEGHPTPKLSFIDVATGSLGQGLSNAAGMAYAGKYFDKSDYRVFCLCGDGESAEGSIWEAMAFASHYKLDNLVNIIDVNRLGQSEPTMYGHHMETYEARVKAFGWHTIVVDGHDIQALVKAFNEAATIKDKPTCLLAKTHKGKFFPDVDNELNWHGKPLGPKSDAAIAAVKALIKDQTTTKLGCELLPIKAPTNKLTDNDITNLKLSAKPDYKMGQEVATRLAYGTGLVKLGLNNKQVIALDGDVKNSTYSIKFKEAYPDRFIECFIAEQNLAGVAIGTACRDRSVAFASTFAAFWSRAFDQIRMGAISQTNVNFSGSHVGCSIGEDGASQMALEDLAMFRSVNGSTVFYPSDAVSCENNHNIKPSKSFGSGEKSPLFDTASIPAPENILATSKPHFNLQEEYSTIETLAAITLPASYTDSPPFKTVTETLSTNEVMVKRTILPIIVGSETSEYTLSQTYTVTRLVTAVKTIPPMEMYEFSPSKSFADVDAHFEPAGSENREQLLPGELEFSDQDNFGLEGPTPVRVTPPPGFLDDLDLIGAKLDFVDKMEEKHNPDIFNLKNTPNIEPSIQQAAISPSRPTFATPSLPVNPALAGLGISPEQLLYLQLLQNPLAALGLGGIQPQVVTESTPVYRTETVYETDTINLRLGNKDLTTYLTNAVSVTTHTDYTYNTRTVNQGLSLGGFGSLGGGLNQPQPQQQPQNALAGLLQPSFTVVSSPVTLNTVVTETITEEFKITFRNRPTVTYFESTTVKSTQITSYVTKTQRVIPTANPFAGLLG